MDGKCNNCQRYATSLEDGGLCTPCARVFDSQSYRRIARILGIDAADREAVERRVKVLVLRPESKSQMRRFEAQIGD